MTSLLAGIKRAHGESQLSLRMSSRSADVAAIVLAGRDALEQALRAQLESLEQEPTWGTVWAMLERAGAHVDASVFLAGAGQVAAAEASSRAASEASVNVLYVLSGDRGRRLHDYFSSHLRHKRDDCAKWSKSIETLSGVEKAVHEREIEAKKAALDQIEVALAGMFTGIGGAYTPGATWPRVFDRYAATVGGIAYRTAYAAMCGQVHNDAEDLLNPDLLTCRRK